jgi:hypothetical protein
LDAPGLKVNEGKTNYLVDSRPPREPKLSFVKSNRIFIGCTTS